MRASLRSPDLILMQREFEQRTVGYGTYLSNSAGSREMKGASQQGRSGCDVEEEEVRFSRVSANLEP